MSKSKCPVCKKNTTLIGFHCRCLPNKRFCTQHRNTCSCPGESLKCEKHNNSHRCNYDWKKEHKEKLISNNPQIIAKKIDII